MHIKQNLFVSACMCVCTCACHRGKEVHQGFPGICSKSMEMVNFLLAKKQLHSVHTVRITKLFHYYFCLSISEDYLSVQSMSKRQFETEEPFLLLQFYTVLLVNKIMLDKCVNISSNFSPPIFIFTHFF